MKDGYDDIINLPRHVSPTRARMTLYNRAAQFMPFKALTGYEDDIAEETRLTDRRIELSEGEKELLDQRLQLIGEMLPQERAEVTVTYFQPDSRKEGGAYLTAMGQVKKLDAVEGMMVLVDGRRIAFRDIYKIAFRKASAKAFRDEAY